MSERQAPPQLSLFPPQPGARKARDAALAAGVAVEHAEAAAIAARLPPGVFFGTSSWSFPGWAGIVYSKRAPAAELAREGLAEYARHPLLTTVGIDRGFYGPIPAEDLARYAAQLPAGFPCCAKAPRAVTAAVLPGEDRRNPDFLSAARFVDEMVGPFLESFRFHTGPFVVQVPPAGRVVAAREFARDLSVFLRALPGAARYAVELRDPALLSPAYRDALAEAGAAHVYNYASAMPMPAEQRRAIPLAPAPFVLVRLLLRPGTGYDDRREEFLPFDRIVDESPEMREEVVAILREAVGTGVPAYVLVNNKAEGCAPATIRALAERLAEESEAKEDEG